MKVLIAVALMAARCSSATSTHQLLTQLPLLMAHDAATCYAGYASGTIAGSLCYQFKTHGFKASAPFMGRAAQMPSGFSSLLDCGARAFDLRLTDGGPCAGKGIGRVCMLSGLIRGSWRTHITTLPSGCRPRRRLIFGGNVHLWSARIDVLPDGRVFYITRRARWSWLSLDGIKFIAYR